MKQKIKTYFELDQLNRELDIRQQQENLRRDLELQKINIKMNTNKRRNYEASTQLPH